MRFVRHRDADPRGDETTIERRVCRNHSCRHRYREVPAILCELPSIWRRLGSRMPIETLVLSEIAWMLRNSAASELGRRTDNYQTQVARLGNGDHILVDDFA
jgi:hypothetical protein